MKEKLERRFLAKLEKVNHISENQHYIGYSKLYNRKIFIKVFDDENKFLTELVSYIFDEKNLLLYSELHTGIEFTPGKKEYVKLYKNIQYFLNEELMKIPVVDLDDELERILGEEYECLRDSDSKFLIKQDKIGKIGEYIFHLILTRYFGYKCIIPKFRITTDRNMSAFGIDALFYDDEKLPFLPSFDV